MDNKLKNQPLTTIEHAGLGVEITRMRAQASNIVASVTARYEGIDAGWKEHAVRVCKSLDQLRLGLAAQAQTDLHDEFSASLYPEAM